MGTVFEKAICIAAVLFLLSAQVSVSAQDAAEISLTEAETSTAEISDTQESVRLPGMTVIGSPQEAMELPGTGTFLDSAEIRTQNYDDINRLLRRVPGVYVREEDGFGLFPNISLRGADMGRSSKVTIMEDGVLAAPAPYSAPAAYYSPTTGRMDGIEVLKGSSQVRYGPHTTGGVINYLSTPIPFSSQGYMRTSFGTDRDFRLHTYYGDTIDTEHGRFGYLLEGFFRQNDGFKSIDKTPDFRHGDRTGFQKTEPMFKFSFEPRGNVYQRFEFKLGYTDLDADETYMGLTEEDFRRNPYRRYAGSRFDNIATEQWRSYLRHYIEPTDYFNLTSTIYYNRFDRNWFKAHELRGNYTYADGTPVTHPSISGALAGGGTALDVLRGQGAGTIRYRHNNRSYESQGIESVAEFLFDTGNLEHRLTAGIRYHEDDVRRFQKNEDFELDGSGVIVDRTEFAPGSQDNRLGETRALAFFVEDQIHYENWTFTPGVRYEHLRQKIHNFNTGQRGSANLDMIAGGLGVTYDFDNRWTAFGGGYAGFSPPEPGRRINDGLKEETSFGTELGLRFFDRDTAFRAETALFQTLFHDLLVRDYVGGGGGNDNVGRIRTQGIELSLEYDAGLHRNWDLRNPWYVAATWTDARLRTDTASTHPESIFSGGQRGNRTPYVPELALSFGTGLEFDRIGLFVNGIYADETFTTASNTRQQVDVAGNPDSRFGTTDSFVIIDISGHYKLTDNTKLFGGVQNLFDREYIVARHPHGPRPGAPLFAYVGMEVMW